MSNSTVDVEVVYIPVIPTDVEGTKGEQGHALVRVYYRLGASLVDGELALLMDHSGVV